MAGCRSMTVDGEPRCVCWIDAGCLVPRVKALSSGCMGVRGRAPGGAERMPGSGGGLQGCQDARRTQGAGAKATEKTIAKTCSILRRIRGCCVSFEMYRRTRKHTRATLFAASDIVLVFYMYLHVFAGVATRAGLKQGSDLQYFLRCSMQFPCLCSLSCVRPHSIRLFVFVFQSSRASHFAQWHPRTPSWTNCCSWRCSSSWR